MNKTSLFLLVAMTLFIGVASCGDDEKSGGNATVNLPVSEDVTADEMTDDEIVAVCEAVINAGNQFAKDMAADSEDLMCAMAGYTAAGLAYTQSADADLVATCNETVSTCEETETEVTEPTDPATICPSAPAIVGDCPATAGEIKACFDASFAATAAQSKALADTIPACGDITSASFDATTNPVATDEPTIPACDSLYAQCPALEAL